MKVSAIARRGKAQDFWDLQKILVRGPRELRKLLDAHLALNGPMLRYVVDRTVRVFTSHEEAKKAERAEIRGMTPEERLRIGADLHAFWVRNYHRDDRRLDRTLRITRRARG